MNGVTSMIVKVTNILFGNTGEPRSDSLNEPLRYRSIGLDAEERLET